MICGSRRDPCVMCDTHQTAGLWTMFNRRCWEDKGQDESPVVNRSAAPSLETDREKGRTSPSRIRGIAHLEKGCSLPVIQYPRNTFVAPHIFLFHNRTRDQGTDFSNFIVVNGTVRCRDSLVYVAKTILSHTYRNTRRIILISRELVPVFDGTTDLFDWDDIGKSTG